MKISLAQSKARYEKINDTLKMISFLLQKDIALHHTLSETESARIAVLVDYFDFIRDKISCYIRDLDFDLDERGFYYGE